MVSTSILGGLLAVVIVISLGLTVAVIDQRATIDQYKNPTNGGTSNSGIRTSAADSFGGWGSVWAAEQVQENTLFVSGSASASADPEKVTIIMSVETESMSALTSQENNAVKMAAVRSAIMAEGIAEDKIETTSYNLDQVREYNSNTRKYEYKGYKTTHTLKVEVDDIDNAGAVIDAGVSGGANDVNSVRFGLTDATISRLRMEALEAAAINARDKADAIGRGLGIGVTRVLSANEGYSYPPVYRNYALDESAAVSGGASSVPTEITPGSISITANVNVVFETA